LFLAALLILVPAMAYHVDSMNLKLAVPLYLAGLFAGCMFCHGELERAKPDPGRLTTFYLMIVVGGAGGSILVGIVAPITLPGYYELGIVLVLLGALALWRVWPARAAVTLRVPSAANAAVPGNLTETISAEPAGRRSPGAPPWRWRSRRLITALPPLAAASVTVATAVFVWQGVSRFRADARVMERNFYGMVRTRDFNSPTPFRGMYHGSILHGGQLMEPDSRRTASSYFGPRSGYGRLFASLPPGERRIGVIGLGAGALAVYCRAEDRIVFYELDPQVIEVARREFTFLNDVPGQVEIVLGDGRLSLEAEPPRGYDVLAIDAFSSDSIPMHLVTREAMNTYIKHLKPDGAIVFQATNRFVDIVPVVGRLALQAGMSAMLVSDWSRRDSGRDYWTYPTQQIIVTRNTRLLQTESLREAAMRIPDEPNFPIFTDDYASLLRILK
jgi:hypothetical protein